MERNTFPRRSALAIIAAGMAGLAGCGSTDPETSAEPTETETRTETRTESATTTPPGIEEGQVQASRAGRVVPVAQGLGPADAIDPSNTETPVSDAVAIIDDVGNKPGKGAILLPPQTITQNGPVRPSQFVQFLGWGPQTSNVRFTNLSEDGFRVTKLKEGRFVFLDGFTISGVDEERRTGGSAIHFDNDESSPKQFNIGYLAFRDWIDPVLHFENGSPYGSTWRHLDFGWDGNRGREIVLRKNQSLLGTQIDYISAGNATKDAVFWTRYAGARVNIGYINIGGSAGQAANITSARNGRIRIDGINFESGVSTNKAIVELGGKAPVKLGHVRNTDAEVGAVIRLAENNANNIIEHVRSVANFGARVRVGKIDIAERPEGPSFYFGTLDDVVNSAQANTNRFWALGDMRAADGGELAAASGLNRYSQATPEDLSTGELGLDVDPVGGSTPAMVFKNEDDELYRWDSERVE